MTNSVQGYNPLSYQGVSAITPPNIRVLKRAPNSTDTKNVNIGDFWLDAVGLSLYQLVNLEKDIATWNGIAVALNPFFTGDFTVASTPDSTITMLAGTGGVTIASGLGQVQIASSDAVANAIQITAVNANGGIVLTSGTNAGPINREGVFFSNGVSTAQIIVGIGSPNIRVAALKSSLFISTDAPSAATVLWVNTDGGTAWTALT
jgi:hypothetical protein